MDEEVSLLASGEEIRKEQKRMLMLLKMVQVKHDTIDNVVTLAEAEMDEEDVAWVEKKAAQLKR